MKLRTENLIDTTFSCLPSKLLGFVVLYVQSEIFQLLQFSSVTQSCLTSCNPMDCSTPGFPVHHQLLEPTQTHVHHVSDLIRPSHPLSSPSPPAFNLSQHQGLFQWVGSLNPMAKVLELQFQHQSSNEYQSWTIKKAEHWRIDAFELWCWRRLLRVPWTARRSNQSILKEINPEYSLEGLMLKLKPNTWATWWEVTHWKRPWCWERLKAGGEGDDKGCDVWMASLTWWTWVWASSGSWWWTGKPGVLQSMESQRVGHDWATELNWRHFWGSKELLFNSYAWGSQYKWGIFQVNGDIRSLLT